MMRRTAATVAGIAIVLGTAAAAHANTPLESRLAYLQNRDRTAFGRPALRWSPYLASLAREQAQRMASARRIWHDPALPNTAGDWDWLGDNVGVSNTIENLHDGFLASSEHRDNLMFRNYEQFGVGVATGTDGRIYGVVVFFTPHRGGARSSATRAGSTAGGTAKAAAPDEQTVAMLERVVSLDS